MITCALTLTVFFDENIYKGIFEYKEDGVYKVSQILFYSEPKEQQIYELILHQYQSLVFNRSSQVERFVKPQMNPKRQQRIIARELQQRGVGTKAMQVVKESLEQRQCKRKKEFHQKRILDKEKQFLLQQEKRKQKHRGH